MLTFVKVDFIGISETETLLSPRFLDALAVSNARENCGFSILVQ